jgi:hypothetical protein
MSASLVQIALHSFTTRNGTCLDETNGSSVLPELVGEEDGFLNLETATQEDNPVR